MEKNKKKRGMKPILIFLVIISVILIISHLVIEEEKMIKEAKYKKVLLIGIDGMDPRITNKLFEEGKLPNFKKLGERGTFINLNTSYPPHSPVAWTSIATGTNPGKHNIFDFIRRDPKTHLPELSLSKSASGLGGTNYESYVKADPFWRITTKAGIPTTVIRWPVTFPPERVKGDLLSGLGVPDIKGFLSGYTLYTSKGIKSDKPSNKIIKVIEKEGLIETEISGPRIRKSSDIVEVKVPLRIKVQENSVNIVVQDREHTVKINEWGEWIRAKFRVGTFKNVYGIFKAHLISTDPFEMYVTTIQIDPENPIVDISYPSKYSADLAENIGPYYTLGMPEETDGFIEDILSEKAFLEQINEIENERDKMFWKEFEKFKTIKKGVYAFVYDSSDRVQHVFWDEKILEENDGQLSVNNAVIAYFTLKDKLVGKILQQIDDETLLIIVSDHGFTSFERSVSINTWLVKNGFMTLTKELSEFNENEDGALFQYVDWSKTKAYSLGFNSLYINVRGREAKGIVEDREKVVREIVAKLENLPDEKTGKKAINKAYRREEVYSGDLLGDAPDIIIGFNPGYRMSWQTAIGGFTKEVLIDNTKKWDGDHLVDPKFVPGVLFSNVKVDRGSASQMDIAPTVLDALGISIPEKMDGGSLFK